MIKYPKINTIWKRDEKDKFNIMQGDYSCPEFQNITQWDITEKVDGTNIRIELGWEGDAYVKFGGRTDDAQIPTFLLEYLQKSFTIEQFKKTFPDNDKVILFGEGFGKKIQSAGEHYKKDSCSFILFDVLIDDWWLTRDNVKDISTKLGIKSVPSLGIVNTKTAIEMIKNRFKSQISEDKNFIAEGIVARSHPLMLFRDGNPIMWKLKVKDYAKL